MKKTCMMLATMVATTAFHPLVMAEARRDGDDQRAAKTQYMLKQVSAERDALKAENDKLKAELDALGKTSSTQKKNADAALAKTKGDNTLLNETLKQTQAQLDTALTENKQLEATTADRGARLEQCSTKNTKLYELNSELVKRYADKGVFDSLIQRDPLLGLKQVEIENAMQDLQDRIEDQRVVVAPPADMPVASPH